MILDTRICYRSLPDRQYLHGTISSATLVPKANLKARLQQPILSTLLGKERQAKMKESQGYSVSSKAMRICVFIYTSTLATETVRYDQQ